MKSKLFILVAIAAGVVMVQSCYKKFDPDSYKPAFTINGFSSVDQIKPANLVAYWAFQGSYADSVSGVAGSGNGTVFVNGFIGQAVSLNATGKTYVTANAPAGLTGAQSFTVSFWVNPAFIDTDGNNAIDGIIGLVNLSNTKNFWGNLDWFIENGSNPQSSTVKIHITSGTTETWLVKTGMTGLFGAWSNHTVTYDATTSSFTYYVNGSVVIPATAAAWTGPVTFTNSGPMVFGCVQFQTTPSLTSNTGSQPWASWLTGSIDEIRIYNAALSASEVNALVVLQGKSSK